MSHRFKLLIFCLAMGCGTRDDASLDLDSYHNGVAIKKEWTGTRQMLLSEASVPQSFSYQFTNATEIAKDVKLLGISCGCITVKVTKASCTSSVNPGDSFILDPHESVKTTVDVRLSGRSPGFYTYSVDLSTDDDKPFRAPAFTLEIIPDVFVEPAVVSHNFAVNCNTAIQKTILLTAICRPNESHGHPNIAFDSLPTNISVAQLKRISFSLSDNYETTKWLVSLTVRKPVDPDYTVAQFLRPSFRGFPQLDIAIPVLLTNKKGVEVRPQSLAVFPSMDGSPVERAILLTATDGRPFRITHVNARTGLCHVTTSGSEPKPSHVIKVAFKQSPNIGETATLTIGTDHPDTPQVIVTLVRSQ